MMSNRIIPRGIRMAARFCLALVFWAIPVQGGLSEAKKDFPLEYQDANSLLQKGVRVERDSNIAGNPVVSVDFQANITEADAVFLRRLQHLRNVAICMGKASTILAVLKDIPSLQELVIAKTPVSSEDMKLIGNLPNLRVLGLLLVGDPDPALDGIRGHGKLEELNLVGITLNDKGLKTLGQFPQLKCLSFGNMRYETGEIPDLSAATQIQTLRLYKYRISGQGMARLKGMNGFKELYLSACDITPEGMRGIGDLSNLQVLSMSSCRIEDPAKNLGHLERLRLRKLDIDARCSEKKVWSVASRLGGLRELRLKGADVTDDWVGNLGKLAALEALDLSDNEALSGSGTARLGDLQKLQELNLANTGFIDEGVRNVSGLEKLRILNLHRTHITGAAIPFLAKMKGLTSLNLGGTGITDDVVPLLKEMKNLTSLDLSGTRITAAAIASLKEMKNLKTLNLCETHQISYEEVKNLLLALPGTTVHK